MQHLVAPPQPGQEQSAIPSEASVEKAQAWLDWAFGAFASKAEEELAGVMDLELRTKGLRSRIPELKWRPLFQENDDGKELGGTAYTRVWRLMESKLQETINIFEQILNGEADDPFFLIDHVQGRLWKGFVAMLQERDVVALQWALNAVSNVNTWTNEWACGDLGGMRRSLGRLTGLMKAVEDKVKKEHCGKSNEALQKWKEEMKLDAGKNCKKGQVDQSSQK